MTTNQYDAIIIDGGVSGAEAACSVHESPAGWRTRVPLSELSRTEV